MSDAAAASSPTREERGTEGRRRGLLAAWRGGLPLLYALLGVFAVWQAVVLVFEPHVSLLPPPLLAVQTFFTLLVSGELLQHIGISLFRVVAAWCIAGLIAIPMGLAMGRSRRLERIVDPVVELFRPISPLAWIPLAILWFGINETGKIFVVFIGAVFPMLIATIAGVKQIDPVLVHAGQVLGCKDSSSLFRKIILPASLPAIIVGMRIAFGTGWASIIAAELVAARSGLGYLIANGMEVLRADQVLVGMMTIGLLGVAFDMGFRALHRRFAHGD
ncbi:MAG: ABC transporter permease [Methylibium sp.]|uniref:ABC transporter permease n=1 Tax=Methylibium sp. TaxID=2067992 RepID=UPI0017D5245E|nr:ABC transporter permease [Methylibium sp.]MBA3596161.1 ABC transporter permease [Methylibium sp.]